MRPLLTLSLLLVLLSGASALEPNPSTEIRFPSPDGQFAFIENFDSPDDSPPVDLVREPSGQALLRIDQETRYAWSVLWSPDSRRFAFMYKQGHSFQGVAVYFRVGDVFQEIDLPEFPEANIPEKVKAHKKFPHTAVLNYATATTWQKDGSLVVTIDTMMDGDNSSITATRTIVLAFDKSNHATITKSSIKYKTETD